MRLALLAVSVLALVASVLLLRLVLHLYNDHGHLDVFHLLMATVAAGAGLLMLRRSFSRAGG